MGFTQLEEGSTWNTMPAHTHARRTEIYLYFDLAENIVVHLVGEPSRTKHLIVRDGEAVLSPAWSMHSGAGTANYRFIWGMAGENQEFDDMDPVSFRELS
jgi:4-deoxy-L-threo-5-hexosulose-uronate ketol-isomerase